MNQNDLALKGYELGRASITNRFKQRDSVLLVYMTVSATIAAFGFKENKNEILFVLPFFGLGCSVLLAYHTIMVEAVMRYLSEELLPHSCEVDEGARTLELSDSFCKVGMMGVMFRSIGYSIIILLPSICAIVLNWKRDNNLLISLAAVLSILSISLIIGFDRWHVIRVRKRKNKTMPR